LKERIIIGLFCIAIVIEECWTWVSWPDKDITPFPYAVDQVIRFDSFIWILCLHMQLMVLISCLWWYAHRLRLFFAIAFFIQLAEVIEFFFNYNNPWCTLFYGSHHLHINVTNIRFFILIPLAIQKVLTWKD
jgi:hypothetical protein